MAKIAVFVLVNIKKGIKVSENMQFIHVTLNDLPVHCPLDDAKIWNEHPRVFIELSTKTPENICPYCSTKFKLDLSDEEKHQLVGDGTHLATDF